MAVVSPADCRCHHLKRSFFVRDFLAIYASQHCKPLMSAFSVGQVAEVARLDVGWVPLGVCRHIDCALGGEIVGTPVAPPAWPRSGQPVVCRCSSPNFSVGGNAILLPGFGDLHLLHGSPTTTFVRGRSKICEAAVRRLQRSPPNGPVVDRARSGHRPAAAGGCTPGPGHRAVPINRRISRRYFLIVLLDPVAFVQ